MSDDQVYVANTTFSTDLDGAAITVHAGRDRIRGNHPLYLSTPELFDRVDDHVRFDVETAEARAGQDRGEVQPVRETAPVAKPVHAAKTKQKS